MDIYQYFGSDIVASINGDLQSVDTTIKGQQRILRRLLTNPGTYIWHPSYGAGLPRFVGQTLSAGLFLEIKGLIRTQIFQEQAVAKSPDPIITINAIPNGIFCSIKYVDAASKTLQTLSFNVSK